MANPVNTATTSSTSSSTSKGTAGVNAAVSSLDVNQFLKLMIAELQNQDPLNPTDNSKMLDQLAQMRNISASDKLSTTLDSVLLGQNLANAGTLIGKTVTGLSDANQTITGAVSKVSLSNGEAKLSIGNDTMSLKNISGITSG
jgi:flagellar basal-body rod modification protein FlgD